MRYVCESHAWCDMKQGIEGIENKVVLVGCVYNLGLSLVSPPCFGTRAVRPSACPACGPFRATAADREALGPRPALSRTSPLSIHSAPSLTSPDHYLRTHLGTDAGIERARIVCPADYPQTDNNDEQ